MWVRLRRIDECKPFVRKKINENNYYNIMFIKVINNKSTRIINNFN